MKNIHLILTDKPSRLGYLTKKGKEVFKDLRLFDKLMPIILDSENQHIYITNDEEIKVGEYVINLKNNEVFISLGKMGVNNYIKKIILTTDSKLIEDGVQAIDNDFLEWFVKNPSCEESDLDTFSMGDKILYNVVFQKEEPKQETTLEEAAANLADPNICKTDNWIAGAKWQAERMYSEEDMIRFAEFVATYPDKNRNVYGQILHAKSKYDGAERTIDLFNKWVKEIPIKELGKKDFITGAKWQQQQDKNKYSDEEVVNLLWELFSSPNNQIDFTTKEELTKWFEQFKKK